MSNCDNCLRDNTASDRESQDKCHESQISEEHKGKISPTDKWAKGSGREGEGERGHEVQQH